MQSLALRAVSRGLEPDALEELGKLLAEFWSNYRLVQSDEIARFQYLCDSLFGTFTSRNIEENPDGSTTDWLPAGGNLDSGDSGFAPPDAALDVMTERLSARRDLPRYVGPETEGVLDAAVARFLADQAFPLVSQLDRLRTVVGCGTVNLFDALCRDLVLHPTDTILMPSIGYGFFLAHPYRAGGAVDMVDCELNGRVRPETLLSRIEERNRKLYDQWLPRSRHHVAIALRDAAQRDLLRLPLTDVDLDVIAADLVTNLPTDAAEGRAELCRRLQEHGLVRESEGPDPRRDLTNLVRPPSVRGWLHINPGVTGYVYHKKEVEDLAVVLRAGGVAAIEDLAYHSIRVGGDRIHSMQGLVPTCHTLFGVSKPFGLANARVGLMFVASGDMKRLRRLVENTVGFVPLTAQRLAAAALGLDRAVVESYLDHASRDPRTGYDFRLRLVSSMLRGSAGGQQHPGVAAEISRHALALLAAKRWAGNDVTGSEAADQRLVADFLTDGLSRWFDLPYEPAAGFFVVVSCRPLLVSGTLQRASIQARTAFDVFAFLAYALGVRTIPEEGMRLASAQTHLLRMAFSPHPHILVESLFTVYAGLRFLEDSTLDKG